VNFDHAEVWINEEGMVVQFKVYEKNGDWTNVLLFDIQKNANVKGLIGGFNPPKGTKVVKG
jgi:outer membrane lipoprotein-sorting protein